MVMFANSTNVIER